MGLLDDAIREHLELKRRRGEDAGEITRLESEALGPVHRSPEGVPDLPDTFDPGEDPAGELAAPSPAPTARPWADEGEDEDKPTAAGGLPDTPAYEPPAPPPLPSASAPPPVMPAPERPAFEPPPVTPAPERPAYEPPPPPPPASYEPPPVTPTPRPREREPRPEPEREPWMTDDVPPAAGRAPAREPDREGGRDFASEPTGLLSRLRVGRKGRREPEPEPEPPAAREPYTPPPPYEPPPPPHHEPDIVPADDEPDVEDLLEETPEFLEETPEHDRLWFEQRPPRDFKFDD